MQSAFDLTASGPGSRFRRLSIAFSTLPLGSPSFAGSSNNSVSTLALTRCAAICAPITPAPSTAALRTINDWLVGMECPQRKQRNSSTRAQADRRKQPGGPAGRPVWFLRLERVRVLDGEDVGFVVELAVQTVRGANQGSRSIHAHIRITNEFMG